MPTAEINATLTEQELVARWRAEGLERAGFPTEIAAELAQRSDVDVHRAIDLVGRGCPPELAASILR